jgi:tetratricopeptide (TPR) repeat protein
MKKLVDDRGIDEYAGCRDVYEKAKQLLNELGDARAYLEGHKLGTEWLRLEKGKEFEETEKAIDKALEQRLEVSGKYSRSKRILNAIETNIGKIGSLYRPYAGYDGCFLGGNAAIAAAYAKIGNMGKAQEIFSSIEAKFPKKGELYLSRTFVNEISFEDTAIMAFLNVSLGNKDKAVCILRSLAEESKIHEKPLNEYVFPNIMILTATVDINFSVDIGQALVIIEKEAVSKTSGLYRAYFKGEQVNTSENAAMAILYYAAKQTANASKLLSLIEKSIPTQGDLFSHGLNSLDPTLMPNALMAVAYAMQDDAR